MASRYATLAEIRELGPELADTTTYPDALLTVWSGITQRWIGLQTWGDDASDGHRLLVAHFATRAVAGAYGPTGPVTGESVGPASRSFASPTPPAITDGELATTFWGATFVGLRGIVLAGAGTMIVANSTIRQ